MPCYHPIRAYRRPDGLIVFSESKGGSDAKHLDLPCGRCVGCRLERSRQWAVRIMHEAKTSPYNSFITLTYRPDSLPPYGSLYYPDYQAFIRRMRKRTRKSVRYYMCGEYGDGLTHPHYHACLFGIDFREDRRPWKTSKGNILYRSPLLEELWPHGFSTVAELTFDSAAYTARYVMKKVTGEPSRDHYKKIDHDTGEVYHLTPEFNRMSLKPGIGREFCEKFLSDVYPHDYLVVNGVRCKPPRYYDKIFASINALDFEELKAEREFRSAQNAADNTLERLAVKETIAIANISRKVRDL